MTEKKKTSGSDNWGTRQERKMAERFTIAAITVVVIVLYNLLDPKHILLEYLAMLLYKFSVLWNQFVFLVQRNWLIYLLSLLGSWIVVSLLQNRLTTIKFPEKIPPDSESGFWEKWGGRITGNLIVILGDVKSFLVWVTVIYVVFISILLNLAGKLISDFEIYYSRFVQNQLWLINGLCGLVTIGFVWFSISSIKNHFSVESMAHRKRPKFFEEMQETLGSILRPMGFEEKEDPAGLARGVTFSRDKLTVSFWYDYRDQIYFVDSSSRYSLEEREKRMEALMEKSKAGGEFDQMEYAKLNVKDFSVEGTILDADSFKSNSISKLYRWLSEHNVSKVSEYLAENND